MQSKSYDIAVIGAGVVGCAMARRFTLDGARVVVIEKSLDVLDGASKGNSAILHTGFDAPPGSLEQQCINAGYREYLDIAEPLSLPILKCGAMVLAWDEDQLSQLPALIEKAHRNGVASVAMLSREQITQREPKLAPNLYGGFEVPGESLIDPWTSAHMYILQALANGAELVPGAEVAEGSFAQGVWTLRTTAGEFCASHVINCAGLYGDIVDERLMGQRNFTVTPRKGQFVVFDKPASELVSSIILPVPSKTTKGVVLCRTIFGNVLVGPTAEEQQSRTDASTDRDALLALRDQAVAMLPELAQCEITANYAGLRPATEHQDYQIRQHAGCNAVTVGGIRSTGLSSALGIARHVTGLLAQRGVKFTALSDPVIPDADRLSNYHGRDWETAGNGGVVCHCELVTRREIERVLDGPMPPATLSGLKRRTRVTMGRCQGFYCIAELAQITKGRLKRPIECEND
uniref:NAD(P)/FAD-dependent oxidoreductase n=1 Tax=Pararhizobium sp. IMCC3301 TaxID=3067904 RepID=UPI0027405C04|nr:NAD(P)/FAD-dependent oxidoreductase [Pararhizobium sp. IMCC3301]